MANRLRRYRPAPLARGVLVMMTLLAATGLPACATSQGADADDDRTTQQQTRPPRPGTEAWEGAALQLPERTPIVGVARLDALLQNARGLRRWLVDEPQMFGDDGDAFVRRLKAGWNRVTSRLGTDPLTERAVELLGIDAGRPLHLGLYPPEATGGREFIRTFESAVRETLDLDADQSLAEVVDEMRNGEREIPSDLHSNVADAVDSMHPHAGFRLLVPLDDPDIFAERIATATMIAEYERVDLPGGTDEQHRDANGGETDGFTAGDDGDDGGPRGYVHPTSEWPPLAIRIEEDRATIDALLPEPGTRTLDVPGEDHRDSMRRELADLIEAGGAGRPDAPRPPDEPALAVSADQRGTSHVAMMRAYKRLLGRTARTSVDRRGVAFVEGLSRATAIADQFGTAAETLTGVSYGFYGLPDGEADRYLRLAMTLYGPTPARDPSLDSVEVGLGVDDRAMGLSMDFDPLFSAAWSDWLAVDEFTELAGDSRVATDHPALYLLSVPRNVTLAWSNVEQLVEPSIPEPLAPLYERRRDLQRVEVATSGLPVDNLSKDPKLVGLLAFDREAAPEHVNVVLQALPTFMTLGLESLGPAGDGTDETFERVSESFTENELTAFPLPESHPAHPFYYYAHTGDGRAFVLFSRGLDEEAARREVEDVLEGAPKPHSDSVLFTRIEPAALTNLLTAYDPGAFDPLDPGILAQRLGAFELSIRPVDGEGHQMLQYQLELKKPPDPGLPR